MTTNFELFYKRILKAANCNSDTALSNFLEINKSTLSMWKKREKVDYNLLFTKFEHINIDWLIKGEGNMLLDGKNYAKKAPSATTVNFILEDFNALLKQNNELLTENNSFLKLQIERLNKEIISLKKENKSDTSYSLVAEPQPKLKK